MEWVARAWRGEERLWKVFWIHSMLLGSALAVLHHASSYLGSVVHGLFYLPVIIYSIWNGVALWRCAFNSKKPLWGYLARIFLVIMCILVIVIWGAVFILRAMKGEIQELAKDESFTEKFSIVEKCSQAYHANGGTDTKEVFMKACVENEHLAALAKAAGSVEPVPSQTERPEEKYNQLCKKMMADYAIKHGGNPEQYIAQNQTYVQQCVQHYMQSATGTVNR